MPATPVARALAGVAAALAAFLFLASSPLGLMQAGHPWAAGAMVATAIPLVAFLAALAMAPDTLQQVLRRFTRVELSDNAHALAAVVMAGTLFFVLGLGSLVQGAYALEAAQAGEEVPERLDPVLLASALVQNLIVLVVPAMLYVGFVHRLGLAGTLRALGLGREGWARGLATGFGAAFFVLLGIFVVSALVALAGVEVPENEQALAIARSVTVAGALGIAVVSAVSEEVFFRGFLQPRVGLVAQAVLFSLAHLSYANVLEMVVTLLLGLLFGLLRQRTGRIWAPIGGHFLFNLLMLLAGLAAERFEGLSPGA